MTALVWNQSGLRQYEFGVDRGVLYPLSGVGVAWSGLISVETAPDGGDPQPVYFDGNKIVDILGNEDFAGTLTALASPPEFSDSNGGRTLAPGLSATAQPRKRFGLCYRTRIGTDASDSFGYKLHLVYNVTAQPSPRSNRSQDKGITPLELKWGIVATPPQLAVKTFKPTAHLIINSTTANAAKLAALENLLYGTASTSPGLPTQDVVISTLA